MNKQNLAEQIKKIRKSKGLTQAEFAERLNVSEMTVRRWEADKRSPRMEEIKKIAEVLNTSVEYLMGLTDDAPQMPQINLPINNAPENKNSSDDLDLGFWGNVAEKAKRVAKIGDSQTIAAISLMLNLAQEALSKAITGAGVNLAPQVVGVNGSHNKVRDIVNVATA